MAITQLSAFLENVPGTLCKAVAAITDAGVNIRALSVADTKDFGILRVIVSDTEKTKEALNNILKILGAADINVEYVYAFTGAIQGNAYVVLRVDDVAHAEETLNSNNIQTLNDEDISEYLK